VHQSIERREVGTSATLGRIWMATVHFESHESLSLTPSSDDVGRKLRSNARRCENIGWRPVGVFGEPSRHWVIDVRIITVGMLTADINEAKTSLKQTEPSCPA
jgi:hypothetical protein